MAEILQHAFNLPTAVFTVLLGLVVIYWIAAVAGFFSFEMFHGLEHLLGIGDGVAHGVAHGVDSLDALDGGGGGGFFGKAGLHHVPRSISWSLTTLFSWVISLATSIYVPGYDELMTRGLLVVLGVGVGCLVLASGVTIVALQPLRKITMAGNARERKDLVGQECTLQTLEVTETFGQAELDDGGIIQVRSSTGDTFARRARVHIDRYDAEKEVFYVKPLRSKA